MTSDGNVAGVNLNCAAHRRTDRRALVGPDGGRPTAYPAKTLILPSGAGGVWSSGGCEVQLALRSVPLTEHAHKDRHRLPSSPARSSSGSTARRRRTWISIGCG